MAIQVEIREKYISPKELLLTQAANTERRIAGKRWFRPTRFGIDLPPDETTLHPLHHKFIRDFSSVVQSQGHPYPGEPNRDSDMIFGFHTVLSGPEPLTKRVQEIEPLVIKAVHDHGIDQKKQKYVAAVVMEDDIVGMPKREMETTIRMLMLRIGAFSIFAINPRYGYYAFGTMEGGLGKESAIKVGVMDKVRDRLVMYALAKEAGSFTRIPDAISEQDWADTRIPEYTAEEFRAFAGKGYIPPPFEYLDVASPERALLAKRFLEYSRQSESAGAAEDPTMKIPQPYRMGRATGAIISTVTGRIGADKRNMDPDKHFVTVSVVPNEDYQPGTAEPWSLYGFQRYALLRPGYENLVPSIEFDEMAAAILRSPLVRVSLHPSGQGYKMDPEGDILMHRIRAFVHTHQGIERIYSREMWGRNTLDMIEYIPANLEEFPYGTGCGKDRTFESSTDAAARSKGVQDPHSGIVVALADTIVHGTSALILAEPIPGTDLIPKDPYLIYNYFVNQFPNQPQMNEREVIVFTDELAQI